MAASDSIHKQEFSVRDISTRTVTLYPTRAEVNRDIKDIILKPGPNEIVITGFTPTADESSIKVDETGSATITDMTVDLVDNPEKYEEVYPSEPEDDDVDEEADEEKPLEESPETEALAKELAEVEATFSNAKDRHASATMQLQMIECYGRDADDSRSNDMVKYLQEYDSERRRAFELQYSSERLIEGLKISRNSLRKKFGQAIKPTIKANIERDKKRTEKEAVVREKVAAKQRLREGRAQFWPKKVYRVTLRLDTNLDLTPASSRRGSTSSLGEQGSSCEISLALSYITDSASWAPRYDLSLNTLKHSGTIIYRADFSNTTSETWEDAKIVLSTSQTSFHGLDETIPTMNLWRMHLEKSTGQEKLNGALLSVDEEEIKRSNPSTMGKGATKTRASLFGLGAPNPSNQSSAMQRAQAQAFRAYGLAAPKPKAAKRVSEDRSDAMGCSTKGGADSDSEYDMGFGMGEVGPFKIPDIPKLAQAEASWSESGLTVSYDIPGLRTIVPSFTKRRHRIASVPLSDVAFSHIMVPKLRAAAFLKATIRNTSSLTLLEGPAGLTLDGSFLGNTKLSRCSPSDTLSLSLGVDPSINVTYASPAVKRSQIGMFTKENNQVYTRTCTVFNTKPDRALEGLIVDQVPLSEDEKLRVEVLKPAELSHEGAMVRSGDGKGRWGIDKAVLKKDGEINWEIRVEPGKTATFVLEYENKFPSWDIAVTTGVNEQDIDPDMGS